MGLCRQRMFLFVGRPDLLQVRLLPLRPALQLHERGVDAALEHHQILHCALIEPLLLLAGPHRRLQLLLLPLSLRGPRPVLLESLLLRRVQRGGLRLVQRGHEGSERRRRPGRGARPAGGRKLGERACLLHEVRRRPRWLHVGGGCARPAQPAHARARRAEGGRGARRGACRGGTALQRREGRRRQARRDRLPREASLDEVEDGEELLEVNLADVARHDVPDELQLWLAEARAAEECETVRPLDHAVPVPVKLGKHPTVPRSLLRGHGGPERRGGPRGRPREAPRRSGHRNRRRGARQGVHQRHGRRSGGGCQ